MKKITLICFALLVSVYFFGCANSGAAERDSSAIFSGNPFLPGNFADPAIIYEDGTFYVYATSDRGATVWYSDDFVNWKLRSLDWPTSTGLPNMWAPGVAKGKDGKFYMYFSLNSEIYAAVADHPLGPFVNMIPDEKPFIRDKEFFPPKIHTIDADCFVDDDGTPYLYWGSGWHFKDGVCAVGVLNDDMHSFREAPVDITPEGFFEAAHMFKRGGKYYLMYSDGVYFNDTYKVRYAISDSPTGPFIEGKNSPILTTDQSRKIDGPGHNFTISMNDTIYIVYHKHEWPFYHANRQVCIDAMTFDEQGYINTIVPTEQGIDLSFLEKKDSRRLLRPTLLSASSERDQYSAPNAFDGSMGSMWWAGEEDGEHITLTADLGKIQKIVASEPYFIDLRAPHDYVIEYTTKSDPRDEDWEMYYEGNNGETNEWPVTIEKEVKARKMRITIKTLEWVRNGLWEWKIFGK